MRSPLAFFRNLRFHLAIALFFVLPVTSNAANGILEIRNGYFWDPVASDYFIPRGIAYQSWNPPVGANQSFEQLDYDLREFKKMYANSVRCEFVWGEVQVGEGEYNWTKPDHLVAQAEKLGLKLFVIIGFQYPPAWFPAEWRGINDQSLTPDVLDCFASRPANATNCLPQPLYDGLMTNGFPREVITTVLNSLTSNIPSQIISTLRQNLPSEHQTRILRLLMSDVINYEHPDARRAYSNHIARVISRYKNSRAIGGWIMGNEFAYFDLWESPTIYKVHRFLGYDPHSVASFRSFLKTKYQGNLAALNANWRKTYADFDTVEMPRHFPADRSNPAFHDLILWRQESIGNFIALGARTAKLIDPDHLLTYSMVGGIFNGNDANNTAEDAPAIVQACRNAGAPLDFWSINNYAWASYGSELRTADFGVSKYQELVNLPVMISETGHSDTEDLFEGAQPRQAKAIPGQIWESLMSGAIGTHLFHWSDRDQFTRGYFDREKGFGIVRQNRTLKEPVYWNVLEMFRRMQDIQIERLLGGSINPSPDVLFFWSKAGEIGWPRANQENAMLWGALKRVGFHPGILDDADFAANSFTNAPALLLSRSWQMNPADLEKIANQVVPAGVHVHANADLPGQYDSYLRPNPQWAERMRSLFGLEVGGAIEAYHSGSTNDTTEKLVLRGVAALDPIFPGWAAEFGTWRIWHGLRPHSTGRMIINHTGLFQNQVNAPGLIIKTIGRTKTALNTFGLADSFARTAADAPALWSYRYDILRAIYRTHFGLKPRIDIQGPGAKYVLSDYRICANGSILVSLLNEHTLPARVTIAAPDILQGKTVQNLTSGGHILERSSDGVLSFTLSDDEYVLLYAFSSGPAGDDSLIQSNPNKLWFKDAPLSVWPRGTPYSLELGFDLQDPNLALRGTFEQARRVSRILTSATPVPVQGAGSARFDITIPDADLNDPEYLSTPEGGEYLFRATLLNSGTVISETTLPVRLIWGARPKEPLPTNLAPGNTYRIPVEWNELPSYQPADPTPLDRAALWESLKSTAQHYNIVLQLHDSAGSVITSDTAITSRGSGAQTLTITVPPRVTGPFSWSVSVQSAPNTGTVDIIDGFEGRERGEDKAPFFPWFSFKFPDNNGPSIISEGVGKDIGTGIINRYAYLLVTNSAPANTPSGFGLIMSTNTWALPANPTLWTNYLFAFDFKERTQLPAVLELQIKDADGNWIQFTKPYAPRSDGWDTVRASLSEFSLPSRNSPFARDRIRSFVANMRMLQTNTAYYGQFDNIQFIGPPHLLDDFEDRYPSENFSRIAPWIGYGYDHRGHNDIKLAQGVHLEASEGSQSAFMAAWYRTDSGDWAGYGMFYVFPKEWALPDNKALWKNYSASFDFMERFGKPCVLEIQLKNKNETNAAGQVIQKGIHFTQIYNPATNKWNTIAATIDQFVQPDYFGLFDPKRVDSIVLNVQMLEKNSVTNVVYASSIDNIRFEGPEILAPGESAISLYLSANDFFGIRKLVANPNGTLTLLWSGDGVLQSALQVTGPWTDTTAVRPPVTLTIESAQRFYRLRK